MQRQKVGGDKGLVFALGAVDAELTKTFLRDERVVRHHAHPEPERAPRDLLADPPEAEHDQRLALELDSPPG